MLLKSVYELKVGEKIVEDVLTPLGNLLIPKDTIISPRDIEIMIAFTIESVKVSPSASEQAAIKENALKKAQKSKVMGTSSMDQVTLDIQGLAPILHLNKKNLFLQCYKSMLEVMRKVHDAVSINEPIPLLVVRNSLMALFEHIEYYNVISFNPPNFLEREYSLHKSVVTALTAYHIAKASGQPQKDWMPIALAGLLMDIGNQKVDSSLLTKEGKLSASEMSEVRKHTSYGYQILSNQTAINNGVKLTALQHHERVDGTGYPDMISGQYIHVYAKICAIADIFHAMTLNKVYRRAISPYLVMEQIQSDAFGKLDPVLVTSFIESLTKFNIGSKVKLSDGRSGEIVFFERAYPTRPWVNVNSEIINLSIERKYHIVEVLG